MGNLWLACASLLLSLLLAPAAAACPPQLAAGTLPAEPNGIELGLGATNVNAAVGRGGLTAALSRCGEITSLKWPSPSYTDQLQYVTSNAEDARARPHLGALDAMGAFAGLAWETRRGETGFAWLRDWETRQRYTRSTSGVVETTASHPDLGLEVAQSTFVLPGEDVLVSHYEVRRRPGSPVRGARLFFYANLAPSRKRIAEFPVGDTGLDYRNDHAVLYDARERAFLHFLPGSGYVDLIDLVVSSPDPDFGALNPLLRDAPDDPAELQLAVHGLIDDLDGPGTFLALGARNGDDGFQAGFDDSDLCGQQTEIAERALLALGLPPDFLPLARAIFVCENVYPGGGPLARCRERNGWTYAAESAYRDAADGALSGSPLAACQANTALARELRFRANRAGATFYVAGGDSRDAALAGLRRARGGGSAAAQRAAAERWWEQWLAPARLPDTDDPDVLRFARRALSSLRTATDEATGAMLASVASQPPYGLDWPRDGAFFNYALDLAGYHDLVTRHNLLYAGWQRRDWEPWSLAYPFACNPADPAYPGCVPPGSFEMNYYALPQPLPGGPISFEIDTTGLAVWTLWEHAAFLVDPVERSGYLAAVCPAIGAGAAAVADCEHPDDPDPRLQCLAAEDDNFPLTQGLQGAETTLLAVKSALAAAPECGFDAERVASWEARRDELVEAILDTFLVETPEPDFEGPRFLGARRAWVIWPTELLPYDDPRMRSHAEFITRRSVEPVLERSAPVLGYNAENMLARAQLARALGDEAALAEIREQVRFFVRHGTTPDTGHMAEFAGRVEVDLDGDGVAPDYLPQNDVPHVWQQLYLYTVAMLAFGSRDAPAPPPCDVDGDGDVDRRDLAALHSARGAASGGLLDPRDPDEDGVVTGADAQLCAERCTRARCRPEPPGGAGARVRR